MVLVGDIVLVLSVNWKMKSELGYAGDATRGIISRVIKFSEGDVKISFDKGATATWMRDLDVKKLLYRP